MGIVCLSVYRAIQDHQTVRGEFNFSCLLFDIHSFVILSLCFSRETRNRLARQLADQRRNENSERLCHRIIANLRRMQTVANDNDAAA